MAIRNRPLFTDTYPKTDDFIPEEGSAYIYGKSSEERSIHCENLELKTDKVTFVKITQQETSSFITTIDNHELKIAVRSEVQMQQFWKQFNGKNVYLDITGLPHHIWAPLLKNALSICKSVMAVYVEPIKYRFSSTPKEGEIFDLSERIQGIRPLPGFITLKEPKNEMNVCFIPLLGFEGVRFSYMIEKVQPPGNKIIPIIGVPGFRPEFPFYTYHGNQIPLMRSKAWRNPHFAMANCPFSIYYTLEDISNKYPGHYFKIAPIGTKPHALGSVLFALIHKANSELVYDYPIRKAKRTEGLSRLLVYHLSTFIQSA